MSVEMNQITHVSNNSGQEIRLAKPNHELYVGQILKTVVITAQNTNEASIRINGQNINAKTSHHLNPGDLLEVKVLTNKEETVLQILNKTSSSTILQETLLQTLPKQAPATQLLNHLHQLSQSDINLPNSIMQQIKALLATLCPLSSLPRQIQNSIHLSGLFLENMLSEWKQDRPKAAINKDLKAMCSKLLTSLSKDLPNSIVKQEFQNNQLLQKDSLPLPGAIPQPLCKETLLDLLSLDMTAIKHLLKEEVAQVLARITANQINHLTHDPKNGFFIMLDLPVITPQGIDVIPLMIKHHEAEATQPAKWSISFALNLSKLGALQGTVSMSSDFIDIKFNTDQAETMRQLNEQQNAIKTALEPMGLKLRDWKLQLGLEQNHIQAANLHLLDIKI